METDSLRLIVDTMEMLGIMGGAVVIITVALRAGKMLGEVLSEVKYLNRTVEDGFEENKREHGRFTEAQGNLDGQIAECKIKLASLCNDRPETSMDRDPH